MTPLMSPALRPRSALFVICIPFSRRPEYIVAIEHYYKLASMTPAHLIDRTMATVEPTQIWLLVVLLDLANSDDA